jgi:aminoglycoside phosphotransferase (APT) family kinase protein
MATWLQHEAGLEPPITFDQIVGGRSNLTFAATDGADRRVVVRRPPLGGLLETAHDVLRESRIIAAVGRSPVPVPRVLAACDELAHGGPFFVMELVDGLVLRTSSDARAAGPAVRAGAGRSMVDALAALHACDVDAIGLGDLRRRSGYLERQLRRWRAQLDHGVDPPALLFEVHDALTERLPRAAAETMTHGDFRIDNCILGPDGSVRAVLDWELSTVGDPLADLALLLVYWREASDPAVDETVVGAPTVTPGFATRAELVDQYVAATGASVEQLPVYLAFAAWRLACILQGVADRYAAGAMGDAGGDASAHRALVELHAEAAAAHLHGTG